MPMVRGMWRESRPENRDLLAPCLQLFSSQFSTRVTGYRSQATNDGIFVLYQEF